MFKFDHSLLALMILTCCIDVTHAQDIEPRVVTGNLKNPCGVAVRPVTGEIYVSDTGRGRILQIEKDSVKEVVNQFPIAEFELDRGIVLGPLGLLFRDRNILMVGTGGDEDGADSISIYDLENLGKNPFESSETAFKLSLEKTEDEPAEGDFFAMAKTRTRLFVACHGDSQKGWVGRADMVIGEVKSLKRFIPTNELAKVAEPGGITVSPDGHLVIAQMGTRDEPGDSIIGFYNSAGELLDKFPTGLNDIVALAYGPRKKRLFALDFSWNDPKKGGLYKLVAIDSSEGCEAELVTHLDRPTAMAFDQNGNLYVTVCGFEKSGTFDSGDQFAAPGKCLLIKGLD